MTTLESWRREVLGEKEGVVRFDLGGCPTRPPPFGVGVLDNIII